MIKNERQYRITTTQLAKFEKALAQLMAQPDDGMVHPTLMKARQDAIRYQVRELQAQLADYEALRDGRLRVL